MMGLWVMALTAFVGLGSTQFKLDPFANQEDIYRAENEIMWCCLSEEELAKCQDFAAAVAEDNERSDLIFGSYYRGIKCKLYFSRDECMKHIDLNKLEVEAQFTIPQIRNLVNTKSRSSLTSPLPDMKQIREAVNSKAEHTSVPRAEHQEPQANLDGCWDSPSLSGSEGQRTCWYLK